MLFSPERNLYIAFHFFWVLFVLVFILFVTLFWYCKIWVDGHSSQEWIGHSPQFLELRKVEANSDPREKLLSKLKNELCSALLLRTQWRLLVDTRTSSRTGFKSHTALSNTWQFRILVLEMPEQFHFPIVTVNISLYAMLCCAINNMQAIRISIYLIKLIKYFPRFPIFWVSALKYYKL